MADKLIRRFLRRRGYQIVYEDRRRIHFEKDSGRYHTVLLEYSHGYAKVLIRSYDETTGGYIGLSLLDRLLFQSVANNLEYQYKQGH